MQRNTMSSDRIRRHSLITRKRILLLIGFACLFLVLSLVYIFLSTETIKKPFNDLSQSETEGGVQHSGKRVRLKKDTYDLHREVAMQHKLELIEDDKDIVRLLNSHALKLVRRGKGYKIHTLSHSKPVLVPEAYKALQRIGVLFQERAGKKSFFVVTSLTRTLETQKSLTRTNRNATKNISTHCYGISFDISYIRFNGKKELNLPLKNLFKEILKELQQEGAIYIIEERATHCFHVTARF